MRILSVETVTEEGLKTLRAMARREKRAEENRRLSMTGYDVLKLVSKDISSIVARTALFQNSDEAGAPAPVAEANECSNYAAAQFLLDRASQDNRLLVDFGWEPSKNFENELRQAAKRQDLVLHFYRLLGGSVAVEVHPKQISGDADGKSLKDWGVKW